MLAGACGSSSHSTTATTTSGGGTAATGSTIKVAYLGDQSGSLASTFGGGVIGAQEFVTYENAHGGLYGHHLTLSVYDDASNPSTVLSNARLAVEQGADAVISADVYFDSAAPYLEQQGIPVFGSGITPGFYGPATTMFFSEEGDWIGYQADVQSKWLVGKGLTKIDVISDANPGNSVAAHAVSKGVTIAGGTLGYTNYTVDDTNSAALLAVAQRVKSDGAQALYTNVYGTAPAELQADMTQVGSKALVITGELGISPAITQQFGSSINGLVSEVFTATWLNPSIPGIAAFTAAMQQFSPSNVQNAQALAGWANMEMFAGAIQQLGSNSPTPKNITAAGNTLTNYSGQGVFPPVTFPAMHTQLNPCFSLAQVVNGQWKIVTGNTSDPFVCGTAVSAS
jgi:branched-chain amino acid transport system substrate-binding protein